MKPDVKDAELRRAYQAMLRRRASEADASVDPERMLAVIDGSGDEAERIATLNEILADRKSTDEFELLRSLSAAASPRVSSRQRPAFWAPLAAAAVVLLVSIPVVRQQRAFEAEPMRDVSETPTLIAPPIEATAAQARTFRWQGLAGARLHVVEILEANGRPVYTLRTSDTSFSLPADVVLAPGVEYRWWVMSELADGTQRRSAFRRLFLQAR